MKKDIHPKFFSAAKITCSCGSTFEIGSTKESIAVEVCSQCHPFYTGKQKVIDSARRVEKFVAKEMKKSELGANRQHVSKKIKRAVREKKKASSLKAAKVDAKAALKAAKAALAGDN